MSAFELNTVEQTIIKSALRLIGAYNSLTNPRPQQLEDARTALQLYMKTLQTDEELWLKDFVTVFLQSGVASYTIPGCYGAVNNAYYQTTVSTNSSSTVEVSSITDITELDIIGIVMDDNTIHWDSVVSFSGNTITLYSGLSGVASAGNLVYNYRQNGGLKKPSRITTVMKKLNGNETSVDLVSRQEYAEQVNKENTGSPVELYYDKQKESGTIYLWPVPDTDLMTLQMTFERPIEITTDAQDVPDVPEEYMELLKYGLAVRLAPEYAVPLAERRDLQSTYQYLYMTITKENIDHASVTFAPAMS